MKLDIILEQLDSVLEQKERKTEPDSEIERFGLKCKKYRIL